MRDLAVLFLHLLTTVARLAGPGGARAVVAESVLVKHQRSQYNRNATRSSRRRHHDDICGVEPCRCLLHAPVLNCREG